MQHHREHDEDICLACLIIEQQEQIMANLDALNQAVSDNTTAVNAAVAELQSTDDQAGVDAAAAAISASTAALNAVLAPPPPVEPAPA